MTAIWTAIEFAPKDGTLVDLWGTLYDPTTTIPLHPGPLHPKRWADCRWSLGCDGHPDIDSHRYEAWWHINNGLFYRIYPTHFMPIPAGPNT